MQKIIYSLGLSLLLIFSCSLHSMEQDESSKDTLEKEATTRQSTRNVRSISAECISVHHNTPQITRKQKTQDRTAIQSLHLLDSLVLDTRKIEEPTVISLADVGQDGMAVELTLKEAIIDPIIKAGVNQNSSARGEIDNSTLKLKERAAYIAHLHELAKQTEKDF